MQHADNNYRQINPDRLLAPLYAQLPSAGVSVGYADNFLTLGKQALEAVTISETFGAALKAHPAGHLVPNPSKTYGPGQAIAFLGHALQMRKGSVQIAPTPENDQKFWRRVATGVARIKASPDKNQAHRIANKAHRYVRSWTSAFDLCTEINSYRAKAFNRIALAMSERDHAF